MSENPTDTQESTDTTLPILSPYISPTLLELPKNRRPKPSTVCEACPASIWYTTPDGLTCFCQIMKLKTWSTEQPNTMLACDGQAMAEAARLAKMAGK